MKPNMGKIDRWVRILAAVAISVLYFADLLSGTLALILLIVACIFIFTSFVGYCPLYAPFGLSTMRRNEGKAS